MSNKFQSKLIISALGFAGFLGVNVSPDLPKDMRQWILEMHAAQIELLKIDWGQPGFCTEWDRNFDKKSRSCGKRGRLIQRQIPK
jgi:hypothetical protein